VADNDDEYPPTEYGGSQGGGVEPLWVPALPCAPAVCRPQCSLCATSSSPSPSVRQGWGAGTATHDAGGLPQGGSYFLGQPWFRPRGPEEAKGAARQRRCPVKYKPPPHYPALRSDTMAPAALQQKLLSLTLLLLLLASASAAACDRARRVECATAQLHEPPSLTPGSKIIDAPYIGNGGIGAAIGGKPDHQMIYIGANNMWSTNTAPNHGLCDTKALPSNLHAGNAYTLVTLGGVGFEIPNLSSATYSTQMDLANARINSTFADKDGLVVHMSSYALANKDVIITELVSTVATNVTITPAPPAQNPWNLPSRSGVATDPTTGSSTVWMERQGVSEVQNTFVLSTCERGGQNQLSQRFKVLATNSDGSVRLSMKDGRCLRLGEPPTGSDCSAGVRKVVVDFGGGLTDTKRGHADPCTDADKQWVLVPESSSQSNVQRGRLDPGRFALTAVVGGPTGGATRYAINRAVIKPPLEVPGFDTVPGVVGGQPPFGICNCTSVKACPQEGAAQCAATPGCTSFGVYQGGAKPGWDEWCQMYDAKRTQAAYPDKGWDLYCEHGRCPPARPQTNGLYIVAALLPATPSESASIPPSSFVWEFDEQTGDQ
jgi:hypothetical protein